MDALEASWNSNRDQLMQDEEVKRTTEIHSVMTPFRWRFICGQMEPRPA